MQIQIERHLLDDLHRYRQRTSTSPRRTVLDPVRSAFLPSYIMSSDPSDPVIRGCEYPPSDLLKVPNPAYCQPFISPPTSRSTALLLSFPQEILHLIFIHGASNLLPKPGASKDDIVILNYFRIQFLSNASLVTTSWCLEAQLEMLFYVLRRSVEAFERFVTMLEATGRVRHLKRLSWSCWTAMDQTESPQYTPVSWGVRLNHVKRLVKLQPVLDELEIIEGSVDTYAELRISDELQKSQSVFLHY